MAGLDQLSPELSYLALLFALFVLPRLLQRFRLPAAITSVAIGATAGMGFGLFHGDSTVHMLSTLGIVSLFLYAGLDVDFTELRREWSVLAQHLAVGIALVAVIGWAVHALLDIEPRAAALVSLALATPSTGFILDSLPTLGIEGRERFWVRSKSIATEIIALVILFVALQSTSAGQLTVATAALLALLAILPLAFHAFAKWVAPYAPKSEFAFLLMMALLAAFVTRHLGVYYLVGAFVVGVTAQRFRKRLPAMASERMLHAVDVFASLFVPFYFFGAGLDLHRADFALPSLAAGLAFLVTMVPLRAGVVALHRRLALREPFHLGLRVGATMLPTLVFTLVIATILRERFTVPPYVFGGLVFYALVTTLLPGFALRLRTWPMADRRPTEPPNAAEPPRAAVTAQG